MNGCCVDRKSREDGIASGRALSELPAGCDESTCMKLPDGKTCGDCRHAKRCIAMFGAEPENTSCGFFPRRFALRKEKLEPLGYCNPDGDESVVQPVFHLTGAQMDMQRVQREAIEAEGALNVLKRQLATCQHEVFVDEPGVPYNTRCCVICGEFLGPV